MENIEPPLFRLSKLIKQHSSSFSLDIPYMNVSRGQSLSLLGPTGAGKSTLLRLLAGVESPTFGKIEFDSTDFQAAQISLTTRRRIAMVHQRPIMLTGSVRQNVVYGLRIRRQTDSSRVDEVLKQFGLTEFESQRSSTLSGGQKQLVALARAIVLEPEVLLLDEPTAHLDPTRVALVEQAIQQLREKCQTTIVWATHNLFQARRVADKTALLWNGKQVEIAPTADFFDHPANPRTADFLKGRMIY